MYPCSCQAQACVHQLTPSHMDFNCGFWQMFVQPIVQFSAQGIWCHLLGVLGVSVRFWLSFFIRWIGVFPQGKSRPSVAVIYTWKWSQSPALPAVTHGSRRHCSSAKSVLKLDENSGLYSYPMIKFLLKCIKWVELRKHFQVWFLSSILSGIGGHVLTWFFLTTELQADVTAVRHAEVLRGLTSVSCNVSTLNTTC